MPRENKPTGISFTPDQLTKAKKRASMLGLSLSAYVRQLIRNDLARREDLKIAEDSACYQHPNRVAGQQ